MTRVVSNGLVRGVVFRMRAVGGVDVCLYMIDTANVCAPSHLAA
jgi:hypothetical protein